LSTAEITDQKQPTWSLPIDLSGTTETASASPQTVVDKNRQIHIVWSEQITEGDSSPTIIYRSCVDNQCTEATTLSSDCAGDRNITPAIATDGTDILVVWGNNSDQLSYAAWGVDETPASGSSGCFMSEGSTLSNPRLTSRPIEGFALAFEDETNIYLADVLSPENTFEVIYEEPGLLPEVIADAQGNLTLAWCGRDGSIHYRIGEEQSTIISESKCTSRPAIGQDVDGINHLVWYADQAPEKQSNSNLIYESLLNSNSWTSPTIIGFSAQSAQPVIATNSDGTLHLVWDDLVVDVSQINYASYRTYSCSAENLNPQIKQALDIMQSGVYRPSDDVVPYCDNQFDRLLILPRPDPEYSDIPVTTNGAFDQVADLIRSAKYEALLSTMWYEADETGTSPGDVTAQAVKDLYDQVKAHPERYPRGMTVRILLGNPPELALSNLVSQVWRVFNHMRRAGVPTMNDPDIGWRLEVANYQGSWPHSHSKMVIIDGKTAVAAGFNFQHKHQAVDHPSGKGNDDYDLGLQMTGPVAQDTQRYFDDLWGGSNQIQCPDLSSDSSLWWLSCSRTETTTDHPPEAQMYYLAPENHNALALYRSQKFNESDVVVSEAVVSAQKSLDVLQVNFTLNMICDLNVLLPICDVGDSPDYMTSLVDAIEARRVKIRVLVKKKPIEVVENKIAMTEFRKKLAERGLNDLVEFRFFNDSVHAKAVLIDDQFLIVGSQNFHYSAFGDGKGLVEFNIGTDDPDAIADFKSFFEYHWERGTPVPEE
jgi:phosphatidylserine/phosphatidylglycerophosphate/cardiolipin synthase-like enzyme